MVVVAWASVVMRRSLFAPTIRPHYRSPPTRGVVDARASNCRPGTHSLGVRRRRNRTPPEVVPIANTTIPRPLDEQTMDGSHAGEIFITQFQAEPVESD